MAIVSLLEASQNANSPSVAILFALASKKNKHSFFVFVGSEPRVDTDAPAWQNFINKQKPIAEKLDTEKSTEFNEKIQALMDKSMIAKLQEPILKKRRMLLQLKQQVLDYDKSSGDIVDMKTAKFLFTSFMETTNIQMLLLLNKVETEIINYVKENKPQEIIALLKREFEVALKDIQTKHKAAILDFRDSLN